MVQPSSQNTDPMNTPQVKVERAMHDAITALDAVLELENTQTTAPLVRQYEGDVLAMRCRIELLLSHIYLNQRAA